MIHGGNVVGEKEREITIIKINVIEIRKREYKKNHCTKYKIFSTFFSINYWLIVRNPNKFIILKWDLKL